MDRDASMRQAAVEAFNREWQASIDAAIDLERCFTRMSEQAAKLAEAGCHLHIIIPGDIGQTWWVAFQASRGDLVPLHPEDVPMMPLETT